MRLGCQLSLTLDPMPYQKFIQKFYQARSIQKLALCCHFLITIVLVLVQGLCYLLEVVIKCRFTRRLVVMSFKRIFNKSTGDLVELCHYSFGDVFLVANNHGKF